LYQSRLAGLEHYEKAVEEGRMHLDDVIYIFIYIHIYDMMTQHTHKFVSISSGRTRTL